MKRVLICPLDWGLGHATRSIPVIREFQRQGAEVLLACSGPAGVLLQEEFKTLSYTELPAYDPVYPRRTSMMAAMVLQLPKFMNVVRREHRAVEALVLQQNISLVVSDNRYGCYSRSAKSIFITHQISVRLPGPWNFLAFLVNAILHSFIRKFAEVWVPDQQGSGLTVPFIPDQVVPFKYIGWLSRFGAAIPSPTKYDVMIIVSGPEPQRSMFVARALEQAVRSRMKTLLVCGVPHQTFNRVEGLVEVVSHLSAVGMEEAINASTWIVARSGYSTVMDLIALKKRAIFVPTPQQPEQLYLAKHLMDAGFAFSVEQDQFVLDTAVEKAVGYTGLAVYDANHSLLTSEVRNVLI
ncbi:MAG: glycosyltransferase [Cytophagales bacterium]|nr:glycosyltransferase [Cytophagales bacterium]